MGFKRVLKKIIPKKAISTIKWLGIAFEKKIANHYINESTKKCNNTSPIIKVGFIVQMPELWNKQESVYRKMLSDDRFEAVLIIVPSFDISKGEISEYGTELDYFISQCSNENYIVAWKNNRWINLQNEGFSYVFYQRPYDHYLPKQYRSDNLVRFTKICYIPYATPEKKDTVIYPLGFFKNIYFGFMEDKFGAEINNLNYNHNTHTSFYNIGYPPFEKCFELRHDSNYINVLWTPRWSYDKVVGGSHFFEYEPYLSEFNWKEQNFMIRPHPMMWENFIKTGKVTKQEADRIQKKWLESGIKIDHNNDIEITFEQTDILISDNSSVIPLFFLTGKPIIYCIFDIDFGSLFKSIMPGLYIARSWEEVEKYLKMLQQHEDPLKNVRNEIICNNFRQHHNVAEKIVDLIAKDYYR